MLSRDARYRTAMAAATALLALAAPACSVDRTGNAQSSGAREPDATAPAGGDAGGSGPGARRSGGRYGPDGPPILRGWEGTVREVESNAPPRVELEGPIRVTYKTSSGAWVWVTEVVTDGRRVRYDEALLKPDAEFMTEYPTDPESRTSSDHLVWDGTRFLRWCDIDRYRLCWRGRSQVYRMKEARGYPSDLRWVMAIFSARGLSDCDRLSDTREIVGRTAVGYKCESTRFPRLVHKPVQWLDKETGLRLQAGHDIAVRLDLDPVISATTFSTRPPCRQTRDLPEPGRGRVVNWATCL
jgi:hypothetical protein